MKGKFQTTVRANGKSVHTTIYVTAGHGKHSLMSHYTAFDLGILSINLSEIGIAQPHNKQGPQQAPKNQLQPPAASNTSVTHTDYSAMQQHLTPAADMQKVIKEIFKAYPAGEPRTQQIIKRYASVFQGIGKHKYWQITLHIDESVPPVIKPQRKIPFAKHDKLDTLLDELESSDIIEEVDGPTDWLSNIVITPKADPNEIRMNIDMTTANRAIKWTRHVIPTLEELRYKLNGATKFTHLDMNHGYNQFELHLSSQHIRTFHTSRGLQCFKHLTFGTNSATELFTKRFTELRQTYLMQRTFMMTSSSMQ